MKYYTNNLPHYQPKKACFFVTTRLFGSIPAPIAAWLKAEKERLIKDAEKDKEALYIAQKRYFKLYDEKLDSNLNAPYWLKMPDIAEIVQQGLHHYNGKVYDLFAFCLMPNHLHLLIETYEENPSYLFRIMQNYKRYTGKYCNQILKQTGSPFWDEEYYDHVVRPNGEFDRIAQYIVNNPVKAGLTDSWNKWKYTYLKNFE